MSVSTDYNAVGMAEADHRFANNLAGLSAVIRLQRKSIFCSTKTYSAPEVCELLDDISARIEVMAKLHKSLALTANSNGINLGDFLGEISAMIGTLCSAGSMHLTVDHSCKGRVDPRDALHAALITVELLTNANKYAHPTGLPVRFTFVAKPSKAARL
ncbi:histidine kinase dimerization/phosphoacceptor domain -containing protein [Bradyrhizobium sp. TZ2]